ncbi:MAG: acetyl-CoA carboxylase biotin carboxyl carrier protein [Holophagaceae bacterium]|nr:acetyl-CoA carboxylase biotin carboxyl carrier protein [Holophagaceae bacterium]
MSTRKKANAPQAPAAARAAAKTGKPSAAQGAAPSKSGGSTYLSLDEIKSLIALVGKEPFQEFEFEAGDMKFRIRKDSIHAPAPQVTYANAPAASSFGSPVGHLLAQAPPPATLAVAPAAAPEPGIPMDDPDLHYITSPIVGTFYRSANPKAAAFVSIGDKVRPGQTLCIVEAMKLMNEIECDITGEIVKVLVENGQPVEYGERLFAARVG